MSVLSGINKGSAPLNDARDEPTELARRIAERIRAHGPITFREFMERALYEPGLGYYDRPRTAWSDGADFVTAPQVDASVGIAVARLADECDEALGAPSRFDLVEVGGGDGALLTDVCDAVQRRQPRLYRRLRVHSVERGGAARDAQARSLCDHARRVRWYEGLDELPGELRGLVYSNELLDALPVHRVVWRDGRLREMFVDVDNAKLVTREADPSSAALAGYLRTNDVVLQEGQVAEICLAVGPWIEAVAARLASGYVLTIDYGAETGSLYDAARGGGTLVCQHRYRLNAEPLARVGEQDITAHVDLGNLRRHGRACGLMPVGVTGLASFLLGFGAADELDASSGGDDAEAVRRRLGLRHLLFTEIGDAHRVMLQARNAPGLAFGLERLE